MLRQEELPPRDGGVVPAAALQRIPEPSEIAGGKREGRRCRTDGGEQPGAAAQADAALVRHWHEKAREKFVLESLSAELAQPAEQRAPRGENAVVARVHSQHLRDASLHRVAALLASAASFLDDMTIFSSYLI